jgi:hypothetical protein
VGHYYDGKAQRTLTLHWNGKAWKVKASQNHAAFANNELWGVAAISPSVAWAAGYYWNGSAYRTLIERWNGKSWKLQQSPNRGSLASFNELFGIAATSSTDAWAAGNYQTPTARTLIERWNGTAWKG